MRMATIKRSSDGLVEPLVRTTAYDRWFARQPKCCDKAKPSECVCMLKTVCPEHGEKHRGTHD